MDNERMNNFLAHLITAPAHMILKECIKALVTIGNKQQFAEVIDALA